MVATITTKHPITPECQLMASSLSCERYTPFTQRLMFWMNKAVSRRHQLLEQVHISLMNKQWFSVLGCMFLLASLSASGAAKYPSPPPEFFATNQSASASEISAGDTLNIRFFYSPELNKTVRVRDDGKISLDLFQGIVAAGKTPEDLQKYLISIYSREFTHPEISVDLDSSERSAVYVTGEVLLPGSKALHGPETVAMVLAMSQINEKTAASKSVFLVRRDAVGKYNVYKMDVSVPSSKDLNIQVQQGDVLLVPRKGIVKANDFVDLYIRQMIPATMGASTTVLFTPGTSTIAPASTAAH